MPGASPSTAERAALQAEMDAHAATRPEQAFLGSYPGERQRDDEHAWILTYLDVLTLVIVVFVIMLTFMDPRDDDPRAVSASPIALAHPDRSALIEPLVHPSLMGLPDLDEGAIDAPSGPEGVTEQPPERETEGEAEHLRARAPEGVDVVEQPGRMELRIRDDILFGTAEADLRPDGQSLLQDLLPILEDHPGTITVEGHTDNIPIATERFPSNWELSSIRASGVVRYLVARELDAAQLRAVGLADTRPVADNANPEGRAANRRVSLMLETDAVPHTDPGQ
ncbi:flagellar motor protein MotB [Thioalkalivibrio versutus]|uniref:Flagellar motor protein MotB n=1 Tax=Thioalkalivibrio versutus TaxID=106634 RepID=A0A0G3G3W5_9GAMM|nr:OmpA family protein [Thioalkalivibrio versutus]AKJ95099.1 flagellar motor protein MotB [Thioalkalivibrio versutus]